MTRAKIGRRTAATRAELSVRDESPRSDPASVTPRRRQRAIASLALLFALAFIAGHALDRVDYLREIEEASAMPAELAAMPGIHARQVLLPTRAIDGNWWVLHTEAMIRSGEWRVRETTRDNAPDGRDVHWSSGLMWLLALLAWAMHLASGLETIECVQYAALIVGPVAHAGLVVGFAWAAARRWGGIVGGFLALVLATLEPLQCLFWAGEADHHGIVACLALGSLLAVLAAGAGRVRRSRRPPQATDPRPGAGSARRWMIVSGLLGAAGLWVSAATMVPVFVGIALGAIVAAWLDHKLPEEEDTAAAPELWRVWSRAGALAAVGFYLLEYAPSHLGWRLEVNHPLYAVAWLGGGELLTRLCGWIRKGRFARGLRERAGALLGCVGLLSLPVAMLVGGEAVFTLDDPFLWHLHSAYITEFQSTAAVLAASAWVEIIILISVWPLLALPAGWYLMRRREARAGDALLAVAICAALPMSLLSLYQFRWNGVAQTIWLALAVVGAVRWTTAARRPGKAATAACSLLFAIGICIFPLFSIPTWGEPAGIDKEHRSPLVRDVAWKLRSAWGPGLMNIASGPSVTTELAFFADASGLGTLYWENLDGLKSVAGIYGALSSEEALRRCLEHEVTHIVILSSDDFVQPYARLYHGRPLDADTSDCFIDSLLRSRNIPSWLRPFPYEIAPEARERGEWALILEVRPEQSEAESHYHMGRFLLSLGLEDAALAALAHSLTLDPEQSAAGLEIGLLLASAGRAQEAREAAVPLPGRFQAQIEQALSSYFLRHGDARGAVDAMRRALVIAPNDRSIIVALAWLLSTVDDPLVRDAPEALRLMRQPDLERHPMRAEEADALAAAHAELGNHDEAIAILDAAIDDARRRAVQADVQALESRRDCYLIGKPFRLHPAGPSCAPEP